MPGRHDFECFERLLAPLEKLVALAVALELHFEVQLHGLGVPEEIHLHGMIDHEIDGHEWLDNSRVLLQARDDRPHRGEIDQQRHAREILQDDASDDERDFLLGGRFRVPIGEGAHVALGHLLPSTFRNTDSSTIRMLIGSARSCRYRPLPTPAGIQLPLRPPPRLNGCSELKRLCADAMPRHYTGRRALGKQAIVM